jgi:hypothetical protein
VTAEPLPNRASPSWVRWLWLAMAAWSGWVIWHGHAELSERYEVVGLERPFTAPTELDWGWIIDRRPGSLWSEVHGRYAAERPLGQAPDPAVASWRRALGELGLRIRSPQTPWSGARPRIQFYGPGRSPALLIGLYGTKPVLFEPRVGVVVYDAVPSATAELELVDAREAPW